MDWQPIDTAPKDGKKFFAIRAQWHHPNPMKPETEIKHELILDARWVAGHTAWVGNNNKLLEHGNSWRLVYWHPHPDIPEIIAL